ncbi:hypothetical protein CCHR01_07508 [Colletotrichum chrysophilum]|uniref:Uncharacterized protein n=1 Tax=Colletotrichum chrysophilum TaxID=1836956 RepID=A0AAD9AM10_9PEZI|nr:hypothetical protein CCHR01_07508 [Colletotrichum chrysophilum]
MDIPPSQYLAGMWADDLPLSLIWTEESMSKSGYEADEIGLERTQAPSWAWASIMTPIATPDFSILSAATKIINRSASGQGGADSEVNKLIRYWIQATRQAVFGEFLDFYFHSGRSIVMCWDTARKLRSDEFFLLHFATGKDVERPTERGLILLRTADHGTYKRVGVFIIPFESDYSGSKLQDAFESRLQTIGPQHYIEVDCDGHYTIGAI